ncbi:Multidrug transporter MdtA [Candidatus Rubidus massiliensis]|nr:Multidrug transporter MdtA [Candidatus Rubidus massiliensis]
MKKIIFFLLILLQLSSCQKRAGMKLERKYSVVVAPVQTLDVPYFLETIGSVYSPTIVQITPQVSGKLMDVHFGEGDVVKKGELLFTIEQEPFIASLTQAEGIVQTDEAQVKLNQITVDRYKDLVKKDYISQLNFEQYQSNLQSSQGQLLSDKGRLETAKINLGYTKIFSPINGKISYYNVYPGNILTAYQNVPLSEIRQIDPVEVRFTLSQQLFQTLKDNQSESQLKFLAFLPDKTSLAREGDVFFVDNHIDDATGTILLKGRINNPDYTFWPGQFVNVKLLLRTLHNALLIPTKAIQQGQNGKYVFVLKGDKTVDMRSVVTSQVIEDKTVIKEGLSDKDIVVVEGQINLKPGLQIHNVKNYGE